ncbi:copper resistance protein CopC [Caballeronia sp. LZ062]|uniref:copper resistance CopC family protein n=1 Tax=unclassified Caballeronia TaxID=2646786 RepID=UPI00285AD2B4|nr:MULTISPECIES: copper resistance protein CopC [unclassified Caballeronia]MDR5854400.1 copper resistance protein CopC [Caballeronia sp. LZ050]MDR5871069.1 copper resistance protein CopC [Caballeronia sp. LZ062]
MTFQSARRGALALALTACAPFALAHALPKLQQPGPGATVSTPHEVSIEFGERLEPTFSSMLVTDAHGTQVNTEKSAVDSNDKKHMSVALGNLAPGVYTVQWTAVAADGHRTQGHYNFTVK